MTTTRIPGSRIYSEDGSFELILLFLVATCLAAMQLNLSHSSHLARLQNPSLIDISDDESNDQSDSFKLIHPSLRSERLTKLLPDLPLEN